MPSTLVKLVNTKVTEEGNYGKVYFTIVTDEHPYEQGHAMLINELGTPSQAILERLDELEVDYTGVLD